MIKIKKSDAKAFFDAIVKNYPLYIPLKSGEQTNFGWYDGEKTVDITTLKTVKSPKDAFFPQSENMMKFRTEGKKIDIIDVRDEKSPFVIFGVRACDLKAFEVLDNVFLADPVDTYYKSRREAAIIFTLACSNPEESCFCTAFGIDSSAPQGDATCYCVGEYIYINANTQKAKEVLAAAKTGEKADDKAVNEEKARIKSVMEKLPLKDLDLSRFKPENLNELFNLPVWQELSEACLGCGACTFVCPTCQCFDIRDFKTDKDIVRFRCWDSCMYSDFTQMAAANPRTTQMQRYRQRFMHKLVYYPAQHDGLYSCVGCGRCVKKCPQHLNIVKVIKKIGSENK